jgi:translation elongation factor EF-G
MSEMEKIVNIKAVVPLSKLNSYSSEFRKLSSGAGTFAIEFDSYQQLTQKEFNDLLNRKALK